MTDISSCTYRKHAGMVSISAALSLLTWNCPPAPSTTTTTPAPDITDMQTTMETWLTTSQNSSIISYINCLNLGHRNKRQFRLSSLWRVPQQQSKSFRCFSVKAKKMSREGCQLLQKHETCTALLNTQLCGPRVPLILITHTSSEKKSTEVFSKMINVHQSLTDEELSVHMLACPAFT